jgi:hypothetical protein
MRLIQNKRVSWGSKSLAREIERHVFQNEGDWSAEHLSSGWAHLMPPIGLRETDTDGGYPVFTIVAHGTTIGRPKSLIFVSSVNPTYAFGMRSATKIEIVSNADDVLIFDRPFPSHGLTWADPQGLKHL